MIERPRDARSYGSRHTKRLVRYVRVTASQYSISLLRRQRSNRSRSNVLRVLIDSRTKHRRQAFTPGAKDRETFVELGVVAVIGISDVEVSFRFDEIAPEHDFGGGVGESELHVIAVLSGHDDDEVLAIEVSDVGEGSERARRPVTRSVQGGARARVHRASHVPVGCSRARDVYVILKKGVLSDQVSEEDLGHG